MKILVKILRMLVLTLSFGAFANYFLVTSDVPPMVTLGDLCPFEIIYLISVCITISEFMICRKKNLRSGYVTLFFETLILILWILLCKKIKFYNYDKQMYYIIACIFFGGIMSSALQVVLQVINLCLHNRNGDN